MSVIFIINNNELSLHVLDFLFTTVYKEYLVFTGLLKKAILILQFMTFFFLQLSA